ncbi:MAG: hypothetical protein IPJ54_11160 [Saprospiraceae bacterium]|nr:hypothetical protein [Saprospiraceae bacterium]
MVRATPQHCSFTVTMTDNEDPQITCPASSSANTDVNMCSAIVNYAAPVGSDNCSGSMTTQTAGLTRRVYVPIRSYHQYLCSHRWIGQHRGL